MSAHARKQAHSASHFTIPFKPSAGQHDLLAVYLGHLPVGLAHLDADYGSIIGSEKLFGLRLPHNINVVKLPNLVEQSIDNGVPAALSVRSIQGIKLAKDGNTSGKTKC
jgi:hypothetical protein